ncbi:MAG: NFACT family protein [Clostridia bacterium]|nr:NFACT family protein [Clostridia bacterium]
MAFDGAFLHTLLPELNKAAGARVEKIYQPSREELVLHLKRKDFSEKLLIAAHSTGGRICFTDAAFENPAVPPMFCMLARKIYSSARFLRAVQPGLERVLELHFEAVNEMGDPITPKIVCEFIGGAGNVILTDENNKIYDAIHRSEITAARLVMPGAVYCYPENRGKLDILTADSNTVIAAVREKGGEVSAALLSVCDGLSPMVCRELCLSAFGSIEAQASDVELDKLISPLESLKERINGSPEYTVLLENGALRDYCFTDVFQYGAAYQKKPFDSGSKMLDFFYSERDKAQRLKKQSGDLIRAANTVLARVRRRMNLRIKDLEAANDREKYRIYGELIKANMHLIKTGDTSASVPNFYEEDMPYIQIKLDPQLTPASNAARYFKEYKKMCAASRSLGELIESDKREADYLGSVLYSLESASCAADIAGIRDELAASGYIRAQKAPGKKNAAPRIEEHISPEGFKILVGHNNYQNDYITTRLSDKNDTWFHTKNIHGSHVLLKNGGAPVSDNTVLLAAKLAAANSRAKNSSNVPVDYTPVKYVKKPAGAKAGMVIYTRNKTVYVTPWEE